MGERSSGSVVQGGGHDAKRRRLQPPLHVRATVPRSSDGSPPTCTPVLCIHSHSCSCGGSSGSRAHGERPLADVTSVTLSRLAVSTPQLQEAADASKPLFPHTSCECHRVAAAASWRRCLRTCQ
jgi:hypothetical protein